MAALHAFNAATQCRLSLQTTSSRLNRGVQHDVPTHLHTTNCNSASVAVPKNSEHRTLFPGKSSSCSGGSSSFSGYKQHLLSFSNTSGRRLSCLAKKDDKDDKNGDDSSKKNGKQKEGNKKSVLEDYPVPNWEGIERKAHFSDDASKTLVLKKKTGKREYDYEKELDKLQLELVKLQEWIKSKGLRVVTIFEGRDAAGKGGIINTISSPLNPRIVSVHALGTPSDREKTQWYFQRYVKELPAAGEWVIFDRSWYNRAGVEKVMGFCTDEQYAEFLDSCPLFERMLVRSGIILLKYWVSVSPEEQEKRFKERLHRPEKRWKLSPMDLYARSRWGDYSYAKDIMFQATDTKQCPWYVIPGDDKKAARLNTIQHILEQFNYEDLIVPDDLELPPRQEDKYVRPPLQDQTFVPQKY